MRLVWIDLETTGLSEWSSILEIAVAEADLLDPFNIKHVYQSVLELGVGDVADMQLHNDGFVYKMHTKNGLIKDCEANGKRGTRVMEELLDLIPVTPDDLPVLAGSSVHFDHDFLKRKMPPLAARFSHRHYDVSAIKLFCQSLGMEKMPKAEAHRAVADIEESVAHARLCAEWLKSMWGNS